ncbi:hypothetical protein Tco_0335765 [Tanacetum coccineum]
MKLANSQHLLIVRLEGEYSAVPKIGFRVVRPTISKEKTAASTHAVNVDCFKLEYHGITTRVCLDQLKNDDDDDDDDDDSKDSQRCEFGVWILGFGGLISLHYCKHLKDSSLTKECLQEGKTDDSKEGVKNNVGLRDLDVSWKEDVGSEEIELRVSGMDGSSKSVEVLDESCEENVEDSSEIRILNHSLEENGNPDEKTKYDFWDSTLVKMEKVSEETKTFVANSQEVGIKNIRVKNYEEGGKENADVKGKENANVKGKEIECVDLILLDESEYFGLNVFNEFMCEDDEIKVKNSKSGDSKFLVTKDDGFVSDVDVRKLLLHKQNGSHVRKQKGFHLWGGYVDNQRYVEGWEDEDKDLNVFDYNCDVNDLSTKVSFGANEFFVNKKQGEYFDKIKRKLSDVDAMNLEGLNDTFVSIVASIVANPFEQTLFGKEHQWICKMNKFLMDSISGLCNFGIEYVGVQSDLNHDGGLVVCNQLVQECPGLDDKFIDYVVEANGELISSATLVFDLGGVKVIGIWGCEDGTSAKEDIQKHSSHLVSDLEDKINFKGNGVLWVIWGSQLSQPHMCLAREK